MIEAPVNGGRNYRKQLLQRFVQRVADLCSYANKLGYMLETPVYPTVLVHSVGSDNPIGADNQQERFRSWQD